MNIELKEKCNCNKLAVWLYLPSSKLENPYYCDNCVPRDCSCNLEPKNGNWDSPDEWIQPLDEKGRPYPCCEFMFDENGFDVE